MMLYDSFTTIDDLICAVCSSSKKFGETSTTSGMEGANHRFDSTKMMDLISMFATVSIHQMSSIMQLTPVTGGDQKLSTADETRMTKALDTISLNFMQALVTELRSCEHVTPHSQDFLPLC